MSSASVDQIRDGIGRGERRFAVEVASIDSALRLVDELGYVARCVRMFSDVAEFTVERSYF